MAVDDKGAGPDAPHAASGVPPVTAATPPQTEWTASDRRGPLNSADEDAERAIPTPDADGGIAVGDAAGTGSAATAEAASGTHSAEPSRDEEPARPAPSAVAASPRRSLVPVAAGLVIGAAIGAGSAWLVYAITGAASGDRQQVAALGARLDALEKRPDASADLGRLRDGLANVRGKVATLEAQATKVPGDGGAGRTTASDAALGAKVAALQAAVDGLQKRPAGAAPSGDDAAAIAALRGEIATARKQAADTRASLDALKGDQGQLGSKLAALETTVAGALTKVEDAQKAANDAGRGLATVQDRQKSLEAKVGGPALAVVADSLVAQIRSGEPFGRQVEALAALGADPAKVALLREKAGGIASAQTLLAEWKPLETAVIATGNKAPADAGFGQRLEHGLFGLVSVRRADGTVGDDLAARVSTVEADLVHGNVPGAYATWQALPPDAKARSETWGSKAGASAATLAGARDLQRTAIDALGGKTP